MIGSAGEEISDRVNGWLSPEDIPLLSRDLPLRALDDSGNDSRFAGNLDTRLKSLGPVNSRHYTISRDTRLVKGIPVTATFSPGYELLFQSVPRRSRRSR